MRRTNENPEEHRQAHPINGRFVFWVWALSRDRKAKKRIICRKALNPELPAENIWFCDRNRTRWDHKRTPSNIWPIYLLDSASEPGSQHEKTWFAEDATNREPLLKTYGFCNRNRAWWDHKRTPSNRWSIYLLDSASEPGSQHQKTVYCRKRNKPENLLKTYWVCTRNRPSWDYMRNPTNMVGLPSGFGLRARVAARKTLMSRKRHKPENLLKTHWFCNGNRGRWGLKRNPSHIVARYLLDSASEPGSQC